MKCNFSYYHYRQILDLALTQGYEFRDFQSSEPTKDGMPIIYLRHDVDVDIIGAVELAQIEHRLGITSTYFIMLDSPLYNSLGDLERYCIDRIKRFGHKVGLHIDIAKYSDRYVETVLEALHAILGLERVVSFHQPTPNILRETPPWYVSTYEPRFFTDIKYISDSQGQWRDGCPCRWLNAEKYPKVQLLTHPIHWGGATSIDNAKQIVNNKVSDIKQYLKTLHSEI